MPDFYKISLLIGKREPSPLHDYLEKVAKRELLQYRAHQQWGNKKGESLYTHVLNGVLVLETLIQPLALTEIETRVLFTAFTIHDINKVLGGNAAFLKTATHANISSEIKLLGLDAFFPAWEDYREDIVSLIRGHSGHAHSGGERLIASRDPEYGLGLDRVNALLHLMRAADIVDLSHTLEEQAHKTTFLSHLNAYLADSNIPRQYEFISHRLTELRGLLTNVLHNAIAAELQEQYGLIPLLYYPDGIAYLSERNKKPALNGEVRISIARRAAEEISNITRGKFSDFITSTGQGIKVDSKCLELGIPFSGDNGLWNAIFNLVQRRNIDPQDQDQKTRQRAARDFEKNCLNSPQAAGQVESALRDNQELLIASETSRLRQAELIRTYYVFLLMHFKGQIPDPWEHIYRLLEVPEDRWQFFAYFDARYDRAYVVIRDIHLDEETLYQRIETDGQKLVGGDTSSEDPKVSVIGDYVDRYLIFNIGGQPQYKFTESLVQYVNNQHKQCVYCSGPFPTEKWMTNDVRSDITVQVFSNRLRGGPGEPKKYICAVCHLQFLLEKLNYPEVSHEKTLYLHLFPYSFLPKAFIEGLNVAIQDIIGQGVAVNALNMDASDAIRQYNESPAWQPNFRALTQKNKPQPYGLYLPRFSSTTGNLLIFPINPAGDNDTEKFLFTLWNALILQRHLGVKVLLSKTAIPPLSKEDFGDLYVDNIPVSCKGLLPENDYHQFKPGEKNVQGNLPNLWEHVFHLFALRRITFTREDNTPRLVRALAAHPLAIFYETDRLLEAKTKGEAGGLITHLTWEAFASVEILALQKGGRFMKNLSEELKKLAELAWENRLIGKSLERNSLLFAFNDVMQKLALSGGQADVEVLKAATAEDIFAHLSRIADEQYKPGRTKMDACAVFVTRWFDNVLNGVYNGNARKMLADEKLLRSAFLFYLRNQIPRKEKSVEAS